MKALLSSVLFYYSPQICNYAIQNEEEEDIIIDSDEEDTCQEVMKETEKTSELQHNEEEKENAAMETKGSQPKISWSNPLRKKMSEAGMYLKHSLKTTLLSGFVKYLSKTLNVTRYKQEVRTYCESTLISLATNIFVLAVTFPFNFGQNLKKCMYILPIHLNGA